MLGSTRNLSVYVYTQPVDMRLGYNGLFALARDELQQDVLSGHLFLFVSRNLKRAKVLVWDGTGLCLFSKKLERGRFAAPWRHPDGPIKLTTSELSLFLEGSKVVLSIPLSPQEFRLPE
jgi:transposase